MSDAVNELADQYDRHVAQGQRYIAENWCHLEPPIREILQANFYSERGRRQQSGEESMPDIERLEYALGLFHEVRAGKLPSKTGDELTPYTYSDEVLTHASIFLREPARHCEVFVCLAIRAIITQQTAAAVSMLYHVGRSLERPGRAEGFFNPKLPAETLAYRRWFDLYYRTPLGTGHGLQTYLEAMVQQGILVPTQLLDLVALLQRVTV